MQDCMFTIPEATKISPSVFSFLDPNDVYKGKISQGGILNDTKHGWLAVGSKFCVIDLRTGLKVAARAFSPSATKITNVIQLSSPLTANSQQLVISLECEDSTGLICIFHVNGSQILRCIQTEVVITKLAVCDGIPAGPFACFDGMVMAGSRHGDIFVFDLNRTALMQALTDISLGNEDQVKGETNAAILTFLPLTLLNEIDRRRDLVLDDDDHIAVLLNDDSIIDGQYIYRNPDKSVRMKANRDHVTVTALEYLPQLGSLAVGFNFGAFQIWNLMSVNLEFTSQVNVECLPVTHFGFQEPCDDPRAFCYLWVIFSIIDRIEEQGFPLAVMYSLTYLGKRMLSDTKCLYQDFSTAAIRYQMELGPLLEHNSFLGGRCLTCQTYSLDSAHGEEGEESLLNLCLMMWECWGDNPRAPPHCGTLLFDLDQWYKDQMPATYEVKTNAFMSTTWASSLSRKTSTVLDFKMVPETMMTYWHAARHDQHLYPNSLQYDCISMNTSGISRLSTTGVQRQLITCIDKLGPTILLSPARLYPSCVTAGLTPLYYNLHERTDDPEEQRRYLLSVALEAKLCKFLKKCAHAWATGTHSGVGCTLSFLMDWAWRRALELKENAKELTLPLFRTSALPDRNVVRCLDHCVQQLALLTALLDAVLTKCCNLIVPDALSEIEEKYKGVGTVTLYFQVVQWFLQVGLLPERREGGMALPYPSKQLNEIYTNRRTKLQRLQDRSRTLDASYSSKACSLLYIDQLIEHEFGGDRIYQLWGGASGESGLYPPPSLHALLRLYLLPDVADHHKHSLLLYLLVDYSMVYEDGCYEGVIRRLMQFPTMFGLSNTAIKATQAFWHLDHRDFDFALDQLQCLTGNTLSDWQHNVVLSSLLAQKKTQAALQYLHVRKPAPIQSVTSEITYTNAENVKLDDWQACCKLYLARGLMYEALDVVRLCVQNLETVEDKVKVMHFFFKCCRNSGQLFKVLNLVLLPFEEEAFIVYLKACNSQQTSDILVMYYLQHARYIEAEEYNNKIRATRPKPRDITASAESILEDFNKDDMRDMLVDMVCSAVPLIARNVAKYVLNDTAAEPHVLAPKPMSVFIQHKSPKKTLTYKSSFIQDTIENASETWVNKPQMRRGIKRALYIEDTPFICTPKHTRTNSIFTTTTDSSPSKRARIDLNSSAPTPKVASTLEMSTQMKAILDMPEVHTPPSFVRERAETPHSILKARAGPASPPLGRDDELDDVSTHTHYSDKHLRFTIPHGSEDLTLSPLDEENRDTNIHMIMGERERAVSAGNTAASQSMQHILDLPPEDNVSKIMKPRKAFKDTVRARLSLSGNSSLSDDPNTSIESIADIPITLINPKYSGRKTPEITMENLSSSGAGKRQDDGKSERDSTPKGRRGIRSVGESTPLHNRSRSITPERVDSPIIKQPRMTRNTRGRSRTPEMSPLSAILENKQEAEMDQHTDTSHFSATHLHTSHMRGKSQTPERMDTSVKKSPKLDVICESPSEVIEETSESPTKRNLRSRAKTPEKTMSPKFEQSTKSKKSLSRIVLESNAFAKAIYVDKDNENLQETPDKVLECTPMKKLQQTPSFMDVTFSPIVNKTLLQSSVESVVEDKYSKSEEASTSNKSIPPITINETFFGKSILQSYQSSFANTPECDNESKEIKGNDSVAELNVKSVPAFSTINTTDFGKSVLQSYESSVAETSVSIQEENKDIKFREEKVTKYSIQHSMFKSIQTSDTRKSILESCNTSVAESSREISNAREMSSLITNDSDGDLESEQTKADTDAANVQKEKRKIVELEREINEIEGDLSHDSDDNEESSESNEDIQVAGEDEEDSSSNSEDEEDEENEEVISIIDSESDSSPNKLDDEQKPADNRKNIQEVTIKQSNFDNDQNIEIMPETIDPLIQEQLSIMTDDNSALSDQSRINLNYSDEIKIPNENTKDVEPVEGKKSEPQQIEITASIEKDSDSAKEKQDTSEDVTEMVAKGKPENRVQSKLVAESEKMSETLQEIDSASKDDENVSSKILKRATSESSRQSDDEVTKSPVTRKRSKSTPLNKSVGEDKKTAETTPEKQKGIIDETTPSRGRAKTPTSTEVRRILTRRASKELSERSFDKSLDESVTTTPTRKSARTRKTQDDASSVTSETSIRSTRSKASEDTTESQTRATPGRKGRKSTVATKPDLSVIPELTTEDAGRDQLDIETLTSSRRLTRNQRAVLETCLEPKSPARRRISTASRTTDQSDYDHDHDQGPAFDVQPIDRITLLNKKDFEGSPDKDEKQDRASPDSVTSENTSRRRSRMARAASETKSTPKAAKVSRGASVDIASISEAGSPAAGAAGGAGAAGRGRRASFTRACEALATPRPRRTSADVKNKEDSLVGSPAPSESEEPVSVSRRGRKSSAASSTSQAKDTNKRSRKTAEDDTKNV